MYLTRKNITFFWKIERLSCPIKLDETFLESVVTQYSQEVQPFSPVKEPLKEESTSINGRGVAFLLSWSILFLTVGFIAKKSYQKITKNHKYSLKHHPKIPCRKCHFFNENHYLKCAVNPDQVLTKDAQDCGDYQD